MTIVLINGFFLGVLYGLLAVGLVVVYRVSRVITFAHGEIGMVGAFVFAALWLDDGRPLALAVAAGVGVSALLGAATELVVVRPLRTKSRISVMVATFGVSNLLLVFAVRRWSLRPRFMKPIITGGGVRVSGLTIRPIQFLTFGVSVFLLLALGLLIARSSFGLRLRATALDPIAAAEAGVNVNLVSLGSWALAGALAGLSAILVSSQVVFSVFFMTGLMLRALVAALLGGLTSITGAFGAGVALGVTEGYLGYQFLAPGVVELTLALIVLVVLALRPRGLLAAEY